MEYINQKVGKYTITHKIGEGGMASVYEAVHERLGTKVAIKILSPILARNPQLRQRFENEANFMASLNHPNITRVLDIEEQDDTLAIVMELLEGEDLDDRVKRTGPLSENEVKVIFIQVLNAFEYAHSKGIVHRDIKPSNIFIDKNDQVKILDFGIAKIFGTGNEMTQTGTQMGTPVYMSPEQVKGDKSIDHRSDIYSLGITLYFLLVGKAPYESAEESSFEIFTKIVNDPIPNIPNQPFFDFIIQRSVEKDRNNRFQEIKEFKNGFETIVSQGNTSQKEYDKTIYEQLLKVEVYNDNLFEINDSSNTLFPILWIDIPEGTFIMGSPENESDRNDNEIQHQVTLSAFKMSKNVITFDQYDSFCDATERKKPSDEGWGRGDRPVINVSWDDATAFAEWMGCRLPTEAEWEYACRAGSTSPFNTGNNLMTSEANYDGNYPYNNNPKGKYNKKTSPVGSFPPNSWGLNDMHGNISEWCSDLFGKYSISSQTNPIGASLGSYRVIRGGSWFNGARNCRSAFRNSGVPNNLLGILGFRLVVSP
jgi:sulfatase modifying factor 1